MLVQMSIDLKLDTFKDSPVLRSHRSELNSSGVLEPQCLPVREASFTDAFLRTLNDVRASAEPLPEFSDDDLTALETADPWLRQLHEHWSIYATLGPGHVEMLGRVETWFTDHLNFQRCYCTRVVVLGSDFQRGGSTQG